MNNELIEKQEAELKAKKELNFAENRAWENIERDLDESKRLLQDILDRLNIK